MHHIIFQRSFGTCGNNLNTISIQIRPPIAFMNSEVTKEVEKEKKNRYCVAEKFRNF